MLKKENISSQLIVLNVINEVKYMNFGIYRYHLVQIFVLVSVPLVPWRLLVNYYESQMSSKTCRHVLIRVRSTYWSLLQASVGHMEANLNRLLLNPLLLLLPFFWFSHLSNGMLQGKKLMAFTWRIMLVGLLDENKKHRGKWLANNPPLLLLCLSCSMRVEFQWLSYNILNFKPIA